MALSKEDILNCINQGMTNKQIYTHLNTSKSTLLRACKVFGLSLGRTAPPEVLNSLTIEKFNELLEKGFTLDEAAVEIGVSRSYLAKKAADLGVSFRTTKFDLDEYLKLKDKGLMDKDIAERFDISPTSLYERKVHFELEIRKRNFDSISKEVLVDLYVNQKMPIVRLSEKLNKGFTAIYDLLKKYGIKLRRDDGFPVKKCDLINLIDTEKSFLDMAEYCRTSEDGVKKAIIRYDLDEDEEFFSNDGLSLNKFTDLQIQLIYGSLLGDGHMGWNSQGNCRLTFEHCLKQKDFVIHKMNILHNYVSKRGLRIVEGFEERTNKNTVSICFRTIKSKIFTDIYPLFYNPIKYVNREVLYALDGRGLAFWFMDDGYKYNKYGLVLCTDSFSTEDLNLIVTYFKDRWGIECYLHSELKRIFFKEEAAIQFQNVIKDHILPLFDYKLITPEDLEKLTLRLLKS